MGRHCQLNEDRQSDNSKDQCENMDTGETTPATNDNMQISSADVLIDGSVVQNDEFSSPSPDGLPEAQPSSSGCSVSTISKKTEKKKLVQKCLKELREFLRSKSTMSESKTSTLDTLTQILDLLKNTHSKSELGDLLPRNRLTSPLTYNIHNYLEVISDEDKDLLNNNSAVTIELNHEGIITDFYFKNPLNADLTWMESTDLRGKLFSDLIDSDDRHLYLMQTISIRHSEQKSGYFKLKNVDRDSVSASTPCKVFFHSTIGDNNTKRILATILPLSVITSTCETNSLSTAFFTKHSPDCRFIHVDNKVAILWGYLPHELLGHSFLSFITDESCDIFESSHDQAIKARGKAVRSNAYQFVVRNGNIITMQTEWSLFVNPWTKLVDFVIGCHSIIEGCPKSDMFVRSEERVILSTEKAQLVQAKIKMLLSQPFVQKHKSKPISNQKSSKVCKSDSSKQDKSDAKDSSLSTLKNKLPCRHMSTFFDRIVEHEYFMADSAPLNDDFWKKGSPQGSLPASGDGSSGSPPESSGSGPSYNEITRLENVTRLLKSQEGHSSDDSSNEKCPKSASCSPVDRGGMDDKPDQEPVQNSAILEALYSSPSSQNNMHRSHSAAANLDHCRQSTVKLTSEILQTFTKEQERQYKANWKRRFSVELQHVALKRALEPSLADISCNSQKISRPEVYRPASMPVIARPNEPFFYNPLTSPVSTWSSPSPATSVLPVKSNSINYYRSLGPTPAPPPGKNFQITSAPLPSDGFSATVAAVEPLSPRQSAFAPLIKKQPDPALYGVPSSNNENWNSSVVQPINLSVRSDLPFQTSVIQSGLDGPANRPLWLNTPGASASVTLQRMTQTSRLAREAQWALPSVPRSVPMNDDFLFRFQYNNNNVNSTFHDVLQNDPTRLLSLPQQRSQADRIYNENTLYANQSYNSNTDVSPIREATESLMLLEEI